MGSFKVLYDYPNFASLPAVGEVSKLYITNNNNTLYRWVDGAYAFFTTTSVPWGNIAGTITNQSDLMALINARELLITSGTTSQYFRGDKTFQTLNTAVVPESGNLYYTQGRFDSALAAKSTNNLAEGSNLYYTQARFNSALAAKSTSDLAEGSNLYYTDARFDTRLATKSTSNLAEGSNLYYTQGRFNSAFTAKKTDDLSEGTTNFYYTSNRFNADFNSKNTDSLSEGISNVYFTASRARNAIALTTVGSGGAATYNPTTGVLNIPTYEDNLVDPLTGAGSAGYLGKYTGSTSVGVSQIFDNGVYVGVNRTNPFYTLDVNGTFNVESSAIFRALAGAGDRVVYVDSTGQITPATIGTGLSLASGVLTATGTGSGSIGGTGTSNFVPKFSSTSSIANSTIQDSGSLITLGVNTLISTGGLGIGTAATGTHSIRISKNMTSATTVYGILNSGIIQSDVTASVFNNYSQLNTAAASFTLGSYTHYGTTQGTIGAGSVVTNQYGFFASSNLIGATNNYGFIGQIPSGLNRWNLYMSGTAQNYLGGATVIGSGGTTSGGTGTILTTTLTNGGSGYVDGTYINVAGTTSSGVGTYAIFTAIVSSGIVTTLTLTYGGVNFIAGDTLTISNTLLGGTGSGLLITVATAEIDSLRIQGLGSVNRLTFQHLGTSTLATGEEMGSIRFSSRRNIAGSGGTQAYISALASSTNAGSDLVFATRSSTLYSVATENMRLRGATGALLIGATTQVGTTKLEVTGASYFTDSIGIGSASLTGVGFRQSRTITGAINTNGIISDGIVQSDANNNHNSINSVLNTQAATFTLATFNSFNANVGTLGAGTTITNFNAFNVSSSATLAANNFAFRGRLPLNGVANWNLYSDGTAPNYMNGALCIGTTSISAKFDLFNNVGFQIASLITASDSRVAVRIKARDTATHTLAISSTSVADYAFQVANIDGTTSGNIQLNPYGGQVSVGVTTATSNASALFQVDSTTKGVLFPRMTTTQKNAIASPAVGLIIYDTTLNKLCVYTGAWQTITSA
jgi:hypothetical protein